MVHISVKRLDDPSDNFNEDKMSSRFQFLLSLNSDRLALIFFFTSDLSKLNSFSALWTGHMSQYDLSPTKSHHLFTRWWASVESVFLKDIPWLEVIFNVIRYLHLDPAFLPQGSPLNLFFAAARRFFAAIQFTFKGKLLTSNKLMISLANGSSSTHMPLKSSQLSFYYLVSS